MKKQIALSWLVIVLIMPAFLYAATPMDTVRADINKVLDVLRDHALKESAKKTKIMNIASDMFDFNELSRRTLGQNWHKLNGGEQKEFVELYTSLLQDTYASKILSYTNEKVAYGREINLTGKTVEVQTTIVTKKADVPINYRVIQKGNDWKVYDVVIEGVSLISNYRSQFNDILTNKSPAALLDTLRKKVGRK
jgi:phospholipid transport system substrate-binding protein